MEFIYNNHQVAINVFIYNNHQMAINVFIYHNHQVAINVFIYNNHQVTINVFIGLIMNNIEVNEGYDTLWSVAKPFIPFYS